MKIIDDKGITHEVPSYLIPKVKKIISSMPIYHVGQRFRVPQLEPTDTYMLCQVRPNEVTLIHLGSANRWREPINVKAPNAITKEEFEKIAGTEYKFELVE